jgi:hypothetical protein
MCPVSNQCQIHGHYVHGGKPLPNGLWPNFGKGSPSWFVCGESSGFFVSCSPRQRCSTCLFSGGSSHWFVCGGSSGFFVSSGLGKRGSACLLFGWCRRPGGSQFRGSRQSWQLFPLCWSSSFSFQGGLSLPSVPPIRNPYLSSYSSLYSDPGGFLVYRPPPTIVFADSDALAVGDSLPLHPAPPSTRQPDLDKDVVHSPPSSSSSLHSLVSFGGQSGDRYGGRSGGRLLEDGYHGGHFSLPSLGSRWGPGSSAPSVGHSWRSANLACGSLVLDTFSADHGLSVVASQESVCVASPNNASTPIHLPTNHFTLPPIKTVDNYLQTRDLVLFWLRSPGFSTARLDELLLTDARVSGRSALDCPQGWACMLPL